jgi:membrane fusion protein (multidrug efflux system)
VLIASLGLGCGGDEASAKWDKKEKKPVTVEVTIVRPQLLIDDVALTGQLNAETEVIVQPEIDGVVATIEFEEGRPIAKGDVIVTLRDGVQRARLAEANAQLSLATSIHRRTRELAKRDASAKAKMEEAEANLDAAKARVDLAQVELDRTQVRAPFDGIAGARLIAPGQRLEDRDGIVSVAAVDRLQLVFTVQEQYLAMAQLGGTIHARVSSWPGERFPGEVYYVAPNIDPTTRRLVIKAWVPNPDHKLKPGMFANVDVRVARREDALLVPEASMVYDRNGTYVWRIDADGLAEKVPVELGLRGRGQVEITAGIAAGDVIVSAGTNKVMAGKKLNATPAPVHHADGPKISETPGSES